MTDSLIGEMDAEVYPDRGSGEQARQFRARRGRAHQGFADEEGMHAARGHQRDISRGEDAGFGDHDAVGGDAAELWQRGGETDLAVPRPRMGRLNIGQLLCRLRRRQPVPERLHQVLSAGHDSEEAGRAGNHRQQLRLTRGAMQGSMSFGVLQNEEIASGY
jgi:hypothetical protein